MSYATTASERWIAAAVAESSLTGQPRQAPAGLVEVAGARSGSTMLTGPIGMQVLPAAFDRVTLLRR